MVKRRHQGLGYKELRQNLIEIWRSGLANRRLMPASWAMALRPVLRPESTEHPRPCGFKHCIFRPEPKLVGSAIDKCTMYADSARTPGVYLGTSNRLYIDMSN